MQMNPGNFSVSVENFVCFSDDHHTQVFYFNCKFERKKDPTSERRLATDIDSRRDHLKQRIEDLFGKIVSRYSTQDNIMNGLFCKDSQFFPTSAELKDLSSTFITNSIFNGFLTYTAIMLNVVTICAIQKTSTLPKTLKTLLTSLAFSDVGVGLVVQPTYSSFLVSWSKLNDPSCNAYRWLTICGYLFSLASFLGVVAVSVERFLAVHLHLRYQELVTHQRIVAVMISIWVFSAFVSLMVFWASVSIHNIVISISGGFGFIVTIVVYIRIYLTVRRHKNQIHSFQVQQVNRSQETTSYAGLIKSTVGVFYIYLVFLACYLPYVICVVSVRINSANIALKKFTLFSLTLIFLNSSLNPVIYCWKMRHIRHAVIGILLSRNRASH